MRILAVALVTATVLLTPASLAAAQTATEDPTETPVPTAGPNEIVFVGEIPAPPGTSVTAAFYAITTKTVADIACATASTTAVDDPKLSAFVLRVDVGCAAERALRHFCWGDGHCYVYLADPPRCTPWECAWSDSVRPGGVVNLGFIPIAEADEVVFIGQAPAPAGTTIAVRMLHIGAGIIDCDTVTTTSVDDDGVSSFLLRAPLDCIRQGLPPLFCWGEDLCHLFIEDDPRVTNLTGGTTINVGLLRDRNAGGTPTPLPIPVHGDGGPRLPLPGGGDVGPELGLPGVGGQQAARRPQASFWLWAAAGLLIAGGAAGAIGLALRRPR